MQVQSCDKIRDEQHDWKKDCEKCSVCGMASENEHDWSADCEKCSVCGITRENEHDWSTDCEKCPVCGITKENVHDWSTDCEKCSKCGKTLENQHDWSKDCEKCYICGRTIVRQHDWTTNSEKCSLCGKTKTFKLNIGNGINIDMVWISAGEFEMGTQNGDGMERPEHTVIISNGFWIGKFPVTQEQWISLMGKNPSHFRKAGGKAPVENVSWEDCQEFISKLRGSIEDLNA
jgi:hypothetical protein